MHTEFRARLRAVAEQYLHDANGCHRTDHTVRVVANALTLARAYPEVDDEALEMAAWLHDVGRGLERAEGLSHAKLSARIAKPLLIAEGFAPARVQLIVTAIADHRFSSGRIPVSLEGKLLQDADRLDALGAIGIARTFAEGMTRTLYHPDDPFVTRRTPDDDRYTLDHFFAKLLQLPQTLHTPEARALADLRVQYMHGFLRQLAQELAVEIVHAFNALPLATTGDDA